MTKMFNGEENLTNSGAVDGSLATYRTQEEVVM